MHKKILITVTAILLVLFSWQRELLIYGIKQGAGQWKILRESVPVEEVLKDVNFPDSLKSKIRLIQKVRSFAVTDLGLSDNDNYTQIYDQKGKTILWNLSASEPFALEPKTWWFPIVGSVPYKGFFDLDRAKTEEKELIEDGWDTRIRTVSGWSTLGWFRDPILSNMLSRSEGGLAELIIHELVHATIFVENEIEFNENLASFIGTKGAEEFLKMEFGDSSEYLDEYLFSEKDSKWFTAHLLLGADHLDSLYSSFKEGMTIEEKMAMKNSAIREIIEKLDTIDFHSDRYLNIFDGSIPNNAYFMSFMRYHSSEDSLQAILVHEHAGNLKEFISAQKSLHGK